jgi:hypothetical protein
MITQLNQPTLYIDIRKLSSLRDDVCVAHCAMPQVTITSPLTALLIDPDSLDKF